MAGQPIPQAYLEKGLFFVSSLLITHEIEHFIFFGTLLGIIRDGRPIDGDDDVDIYVNKKERVKLLEVLSAAGITVNLNSSPNQTEHFLQIKFSADEIWINIDFYFYDSDADSDFITEKWNFTGCPQNEKCVLKIPKPLVFPLHQTKFDNTWVSLPNHSRILCEFLYGPSWRKPQQKDRDYIAITVGGRPLRIKHKRFFRGIKILD